MKKSLLCLVSLLFAFVATSAFGGPQSAAPPFVVSSDAARFGAEETRPQVQYFYDENNRLHLADVLKDRSKFTPSKGRGDTLNFGYVEGTLWLTFEIKNAGPEAIDLVLLYDYPPMQTLDFHFVGDDGAVRQSVQTGRLRPFDERALWHRSFAFPLHLAPFEIGSVFLRLQTSGSLQVPLQILTKDQFSSRVQREYLGFGIYYGFVILMLIYSVFAFNSIRDKNYLFYAAYIASVTFAQLCLHGLAYQFLWPASPEWNRVCILVFVGLSFVSLSIFTMNFLGTKTSSPVIHRVLVIYAAAAILTSLFPLVAYGNMAVRISGFLTAILPAVFLPAAIVSVLRRVPSARFFLFAIVLYTIGVGLYGLKDMGIVPTNFFTENGIVLGSAFEVALFSLGLANKMKLLENDRKKLEISNQRNSAIAGVTQALAHDVRKPFSMFKMIIDMVDAMRDPESAQKLLKQSLPEVQRAMASVEGMIQDVMQVGSDSKPVVELTNPETLIEATINEIFRVYPDSDVAISYDLRHAHKVNVDTLKVGRVFSNIVGNAVQAMNYRGEIWFRTREVEGGKLVEFCLGNAGSFIPAESLPKLFEAFFTSEKKGGTGLGLAIAQKIVQAHGGRIWCESVKDAQHPHGKVEFFFTLPTDKARTDGTARLPTNSGEVAQALAQFRLRAAQGGGAVNDEQEARLESELLGKIKAQKAPLPLLIVDDEAVYRNALASLIARSEDLSAKFLIRFAADAAEGVRLAEAEKPFLVILDVDLGAGSASGIDAVRTMREKGFAGRVCIHSNRFLADDYRTALEAGANTVLPKPMPRAHFLKVILEALEPLAAEAPSEPISRPEVVFIDDTEIFRMAWEIKLSRDTVFHGFDGARSFWRKVEQEPEFLSRLTCVITDYHFATGEFETGVQLGAKLKARGFAAPVLLASDGDFKLDDVRNGVDHVVPKGTLTWAELRPVVESIAIQSNTKET